MADNGVLIAGANPSALMVGRALKEAEIDVLVASSHYDDIAKARMLGLRTYYGSPTSTHADSNLDLLGMGYLFAMSTDREINTLCQWHYEHDFGDDKFVALFCLDENNFIQMINDKGEIPKVCRLVALVEETVLEN